jgi:hypothetical protein
MALALLALLVGVAVVLVARRLSGALVRPLTGTGILLAAVAIVSVVLVFRKALPSTEYSVLGTRYYDHPLHQRPLALVFHVVVPSLAAFAILASLSIAGTPLAGLVVAWLLLIAAESCQWVVRFRPELRILRVWPTIHSLAQPLAESTETDEAEIPDGLLQQVTRTIDGERESIHALLKAEIAGGDRLGVIHVAFCPPLATLPELTAHAVDCDDVDMRISQSETFGARIEVRLAKKSALSRSILVELLGSASASRTDK